MIHDMALSWPALFQYDIMLLNAGSFSPAKMQVEELPYV